MEYKIAKSEGRTIHGRHLEREALLCEGESSRSVVSLYGDRRGSSSECFSDSERYMAACAQAGSTASIAVEEVRYPRAISWREHWQSMKPKGQSSRIAAPRHGSFELHS